MKIFLIILILFLFPTESFSQFSSIHNADKQAYGQVKELNFQAAEAGAEIIPLQLKKTNLSASVFGFLPDDNYPAAKNYLRYDLLTHIACIDFYADSLGNVSNPKYWPWIDVINKAHQNGVKMILCTTNFVASQMHYLLYSDSAKQNLFTNLKQKVKAYQLDGVNIDFERFYSTDSGELLNGFVAELTAYLHSEIPGCEVSFAGPHLNWGGNWKFGGLADACDYIFVMGYAYAGISSKVTGSNAPLLGGTNNVTTTLTEQYGEVLKSNPKKLILGVPYYGNSWITRTTEPHAEVVSFVKTQPYSSDIVNAKNSGLIWDNTEKSPWYLWKVDDTTWCQVWFDNDSSLGLKYDLAKSYNLKGVGMWALGYDGNRTELWSALEKHFIVSDIGKQSLQTAKFELLQNYPNPFNPSTIINYTLPVKSFVTLKLYDVLGNEVLTLVDEEKPAGNYHYELRSAMGEMNCGLATGVYFYQLNAGGFTQTKKMLYLK